MPRRGLPPERAGPGEAESEAQAIAVQVKRPPKGQSGPTAQPSTPNCTLSISLMENPIEAPSALRALGSVSSAKRVPKSSSPISTPSPRKQSRSHPKRKREALRVSRSWTPSASSRSTPFRWGSELMSFVPASRRFQNDPLVDVPHVESVAPPRSPTRTIRVLHRKLAHEEIPLRPLGALPGVGGGIEGRARLSIEKIPIDCRCPRRRNRAPDFR